MTDAIDLLFTETRTVAGLGAAAIAGIATGWFLAPLIGVFAFLIGFVGISGLSIARCSSHRVPVTTVQQQPVRI